MDAFFSTFFFFFFNICPKVAFNKSSLGVGGRFKREGIYVCLWLIHVAVQKPAQHCKEIIMLIQGYHYNPVRETAKETQV